MQVAKIVISLFANIMSLGPAQTARARNAERAAPLTICTIVKANPESIFSDSGNVAQSESHFAMGVSDHLISLIMEKSKKHNKISDIKAKAFSQKFVSSMNYNPCVDYLVNIYIDIEKSKTEKSRNIAKVFIKGTHGYRNFRHISIHEYDKGYGFPQSQIVFGRGDLLEISGKILKSVRELYKDDL